MLQPSEERKLATVMFADLVGSTELAGSQDPERTRVLLDRFYDAMAAEIEHAGGTVEKFIGDAVMAAFGAPLALEDHAERALHAALAMQERLVELFDGQVSLRIGVNTGEVVVGRAREGSSFVTGDVVNVAARLEQAAGGGEVLVGERSVAAVRGAFEFEDAINVEAKGKAGGVAARRLVRALSLMRPRGVSGLFSAFVGRDRELAGLCEAFREVCERKEARLVVIVGEAGVGKTRIVRELWAWLGDQTSQPLRRTGRCLSYGTATAYWPLAEVLREHFGLPEDESPDTVLDRLGDRQSLARTLGIDTGEDLHPLVARERLHDGWTGFLEELAAERPTVILIEDVHWADDELLELLETLVGQVRGPLLVVATARPDVLDRRPSIGAGRSRSIVPLEALPATDADELLSRLLGSAPPDSVREAVVERSEGNPFFVEELLATLIDRVVLVRENGAWSCGELPEGFVIPDTVQAVLAARIDLLPETEKAALQAAAVIGRVFWTRPVYDLLGGATPDFGLLEEREFVRRRLSSTIAGEREYAIKHALTREVAYASLPKARRAQLHAGFAGWLEELTGGGDEHAALLAHHFAEAVRGDDIDLAWSGRMEEADRLRAKACAWCRRAADLAISRYEMDAGLALLERAAELEPARDRQAELWLQIGQANAIKYDGAAFAAAMEKALELGANEGRVYAELVYQAAQRGAMWNPALGDELEVWAERALQATAPGSLERGKALAGAASHERAPERAQEALEIAEELDEDDLRSAALFTLVDAYYGTGDFTSMMAAIEQNVALLPRITDPDLRANIYVQAASFPGNVGRFRESLEAAALLEQTTAGLTPHHRMHAAGVRVGLAYDMGDWQRVCDLTPLTEATVDANLATPCMLNQSALLICAIGHQLVGDKNESERLEAKAEALNLQGYDQGFDGLRLNLALSRGDLTRVEALVNHLEQPATHDNWARIDILGGLIALGELTQIEDKAPGWLVPGTYFEPFVLRALGAARNDTTMIDEAITLFKQMGLEWHAEETRMLVLGKPPWGSQITQQPLRQP